MKIKKIKISHIILYLVIPILIILALPRTYQLYQLNRDYIYLNAKITGISQPKDGETDTKFDISYSYKDNGYSNLIIADESFKVDINDKCYVYVDKDDPSNIIEFNFTDKTFSYNVYIAYISALILIESVAAIVKLIKKYNRREK